MTLTPLQLAEKTVAYAQKKGAQQAAASTSRERFIDLQHRDGQLEKIRESSSAGLSIDLYVDGRYASHSTSDLRWNQVEAFVDRAVALTRLLTEDKDRGLADPKLYANRPTVDLELWDDAHGSVDTDRRKAISAELETVAKGKSDQIISVTGGYYDTTAESARVHSNGFTGERRTTQFWWGAEVSVKDAEGRKPEDYHWVGGRHLKGLPAPAEVAAEAARRALSRRGQKKIDSGDMTVVFENRAARRLMRHLLGPMSGWALHQKRSFLQDKLGKKIANPALTLIDDPLIPGELGSRHYDGDGISARKRTLVDEGVLEEYLIDVYYGRKLGNDPTGGSTSNLIIEPGKRDAEAIVGGVNHGIFVTGILGGNADSTTGDFSHGVAGFEIKDGKLGDPIGEMNITGSHTTLWNGLIEVGNDPYPFSTTKTPTLVFEKVAVSGN